MVQLHKVFLVLLAVNALFLIVFYSRSHDSADEPNFDLSTNQNLLTKEPNHSESKESKNSKKAELDAEILESQEQLHKIKELLKEAKSELEEVEYVRKTAPKKLEKCPFKPFYKSDVDHSFATFPRTKNPFYMLGAYEKIVVEIPFENKPEKNKYDQVLYGYQNDDDYCERVDYYNLARPERIFNEKVFFTDYQANTIPRRVVIPSIGRNVIPKFNKKALRREERRLYHFDVDINNFFVNADGFHQYHEVGKNFLCATQMFNHIPGQRALVRKDDLVEAVDQYAVKYQDKPQCFNKSMFFPYSHRLYREEECKTFFNIINGKEYLDSLKQEPIQFIMKIGHGSHSANGVSILDREETERINKEYDHGRKCRNGGEPYVAQAYVSNPLLLDMHNKFDFRIYMLVASTHPLMAYYHDGFLRASLSRYEKKSSERGKHLTNTHLAEDIFRLAKENGTYNGKSEQELRDYHIWKFEELQEYLLEAGKIDDENWLDNHLRPQFRKAMIHILKMTSGFFMKQSNIYGLYGLDFMLDDKFNLWFIEGNPNPQLMATSEFLGDLLEGLLRSLFDIEYGLYKSRMTRVLRIVEKMQADQESGKKVDLQKYKEEYKKATKNKFEPEYKVGKNSTFSLILDESIEGPGAYFGNIDDECVLEN